MHNLMTKRHFERYVEMKNKNDIKQIVFMYLIFLGSLLAFLGAQGTGDHKYFFEWVNNVDTYGLIEGFKMNQNCYPPLATLILYIFNRVFSFIPGSALFAIRFSTLLAMMISCIIVQLIFRNVNLCYILFFSLIFSVTNGYLDILMLPLGLISYYMICKEKYFLFGLFLSLACLIKFQPLIILPIIAVGYFEFEWKEYVHVKWKNGIKTMTGGVIPVLLMFLVYGKPFLYSIMSSMSTVFEYLSPNGLNVGWIIQSIYEIVTGSMDDNKFVIMNAEPCRALVLFKYVFWIIYLCIFIKILLTKSRTRLDIIKGCLVVYTAYYLFNTNVHENHFFIGVILAFLMYAEAKDLYQIMIFATYMFNINLLVFYGIWGTTNGFNRVICGKIDPTLYLACVNVILGIYIILMMFRTIGSDKRIEEYNL